mmetsp:Transcript_45324/g.96417  ORF Transcript_45324/g.96417 Transcript_45324/m.96417 type:complete len:252 (-) Transcript_45324:659-1414(-)
MAAPANAGLDSACCTIAHALPTWSALPVSLCPRDCLYSASTASKSDRVTWRRSCRTAEMAASLTRFSSSAPESPPEARATCLRSSSDSSRTVRRACTLRICIRAASSGSGSCSTRSNRPGRTRAGSSAESRLVAPMTRTRALEPKPSICASSWLSVCSCSSEPCPPALRLPPSASSSSMKRTHGARLSASSKSERTRRAPLPTYTSTKSEPEQQRKGTPAVFATALASNVLPVPGGPAKSRPRGCRAPSLA